MIETEKNLAIRFMPFTNKTIATTVFSTNVDQILNNFNNLSPASGEIVPNQTQVASDYTSDITQLPLLNQHIFMIYTPTIAVYNYNKYVCL